MTSETIVYIVRHL